MSSKRPPGRSRSCPRTVCFEVSHSGASVTENKLMKPFTAVIPKGNTLFLLSFPAYAFQTLPHAPTASPEVQEPLAPLDPIDPSDPLAFLSESVPVASPSSTQDRHQHFETSLKSIPHIEIDILGSAFAFRSEDRVGRKFKPGTVLDQGWAADWLLPEMFDE